MTLVKLRQAFPNQDLVYHFGVSVSTVSNIMNTWFQYVYTQIVKKKPVPAETLTLSTKPFQLF